MKRILCFGDSNTWGFVPGTDGERYPHDVRWPGVMSSALGSAFTIIEEAQNGRTTMWDDPCESVSKNGLRHLPVILESHAPIHLVIVMLGTNDLKSYFNMDANAIAHGCGVLVDRILESKAGAGGASPKVLQVTPAAVTDEPSPFGHIFDKAAAVSAGFEIAYTEIAEARGIPFIHAGDYARCPVPDTIHIDQKGHEALGKAIARKVESLL